MAPPKEKRRLCSCGCQKQVAKSTENRHLAGIAPSRILATQLLSDGGPLPKRPRISHPPSAPPAIFQASSQPRPPLQEQPDDSSNRMQDSPPDIPLSENENEHTDHNLDTDYQDADEAPGPAVSVTPALHCPRPTVEEVEDDDSDFQPVGRGTIDDDDFIGEGEDVDEDMGSDRENFYYAPIDEMGEQFEREIAQIGTSSSFGCAFSILITFSRRVDRG